MFLTRQFRLPAFVNGHADGMLLEAPAGLLDPRRRRPRSGARSRRRPASGCGEVEEVFAAYMSPGSVTERLHFFVAEVSLADRIAAGGGDADEGEDIEVVELPFRAALATIAKGEIVDGKTIMLLYHAKLKALI